MEKPKVRVSISGESGNVFEVMSNSIKALDEQGKHEEALQLTLMLKAVMQVKTTRYSDILEICGMYVDLGFEM